MIVGIARIGYISGSQTVGRQRFINISITHLHLIKMTALYKTNHK